jgi:hypothetical protein
VQKIDEQFGASRNSQHLPGEEDLRGSERAQMGNLYASARQKKSMNKWLLLGVTFSR